MSPAKHAAWGALLCTGWLVAVSADQASLLAVSEALEDLGDGVFAGWGVDAILALPILAIVAGSVAMVRRAPGPGRRGPAIGVVIATGLLVASVYAGYRDLILHRFAAVAPSVLYRSGQTSLSSLDGLIAAHGVRTLLFLREPGVELTRERDLTERRGIHFEHIPMTRPKAATKRFLQVMDDPKNLPVLIHCEYGIARTGLLSAIYRMEYEGWDNQRALDEARWYAGFDGFGKNSDKRAFLLAYNPRHHDRTGGLAPRKVE